jgi:hypothetical protein
MVGMTVPVTQKPPKIIPQKRENSKYLELVTSGMKITALQGGTPFC